MQPVNQSDSKVVRSSSLLETKPAAEPRGMEKEPLDSLRNPTSDIKPQPTAKLSKDLRDNQIRDLDRAFKSILRLLGIDFYYEKVVFDIPSKAEESKEHSSLFLQEQTSKSQVKTQRSRNRDSQMDVPKDEITDYSEELFKRIKNFMK